MWLGKLDLVPSGDLRGTLDTWFHTYISTTSLPVWGFTGTLPYIIDTPPYRYYYRYLLH